MNRYIKMMKSILFLLSLSALLVFAWSPKSYGDPYDALRDYKHPIICKPVVVTNGITVIGDKSTWVELPWKDLLAISDRLLFRYLDGAFEVPHTGYVCMQ